MRIGGEVKSFLNSNSQSSHKRLTIVMFGSCLINVKIKFINVRTLSYVQAKFEHRNSWYTRQYNALLKTDLFHIQLQLRTNNSTRAGHWTFDIFTHLLYFFPPWLQLGAIIFWNAVMVFSYFWIQSYMHLVPRFFQLFKGSIQDGGHACPRL